MTDGTTRRHNDGKIFFWCASPEGGGTQGEVRIVEETYLPGMSVSLVAVSRRDRGRGACIKGDQNAVSSLFCNDSTGLGSGVDMI